MFSWLIGRLNCLRGRHERSRKLARKVGDGDRYTSKCVYCGKPMERIAKRNWIVTPKR